MSFYSAHQGNLSQSYHNMETFNFDHPLTPLVLLVSKTLEVQCPGCGDMKRMLVRHMKTDEACRARCSSIELDLFDQQLKRFRHRRQMKESKQRKKEESEAVFCHRAEYKKRRREERMLESPDMHNSYWVQDTAKTSAREMPDYDYDTPPRKQSREEHRGKEREEVHLLKIGELIKEEYRSPVKSEVGAKQGEGELAGEGANDAAPTLQSSVDSLSSVQNTLSPAQMVKVRQLLLLHEMDHFLKTCFESGLWPLIVVSFTNSSIYNYTI